MTNSRLQRIALALWISLFMQMAIYAQTLNPTRLRAMIYMENEAWIEAVQCFDSLIEAGTRDPTLFVYKGHCLIAMNNLAGAKQAYALAEQKRAGNGAYELSKIFASRETTDSTLYYLSIHLKTGPRVSSREIRNEPAFRFLWNTEGWLDLWKEDPYTRVEKIRHESEYLIRQGRYPMAHRMLDEAINQHPTRHDFYATRAELFLQQGDLNRALADISKALDIQSRDAGYLLTRSGIYLEQNKYQLALHDIERALRIDPYLVTLYHQRALCNYRLGNFAASAKDFNLFRDVEPDNPDFLFLGSLLEMNKGNYFNALAYLDDLLENPRPRPEWYDTRGEARLMVKSYQGAVEDFSMSLDLYPLNSRTLLNKGVARYHLGETRDACSDWEKALRYGNNEALQYLQKYCK